MTTAISSHNASFLKQLSRSAEEWTQRYLLPIGNVMYGSQMRTWVTLALTFSMLIGGIYLMQTGAQGGMCGWAG